MIPVSSLFIKKSWIKKTVEARKSAMLKQMLVLADLVDRKAGKGKSITRVRSRHTVDAPNRIFVTMD